MQLCVYLIQGGINMDTPTKRRNTEVENDLELLEMKKKAREETLTTGLFGLIFGAVGTIILSIVLYSVGYSVIEDMNKSGDLMANISILALGYTIPVYLLLLLGLFKTTVLMLKSLWIFVKYLFVSAEEYDLENEPDFRV